jgi:hypothetical protein
MKKIIYIFFSWLLTFSGFCQQKDSLLFKGQLSGSAHFNPGNDLPIWFGGRYIPQLNSGFNLRKNQLIDFEASANIFGNVGIDPFNKAEWDGKIKPYRAWVRFSGKQYEIRAGLQKINFGSANILRPLMWFDQIDPRDPLRLTDGVWGVLGRYYFLNNANLWLWGLYGNKNPRGWELAPTSNQTPEFGGRIQLPVPKGEAAISYHHRNAFNSHVGDTAMPMKSVENRIGLDARFDWIIGCWVEGSWTTNNRIEISTNQAIANVGFDYTFGIGNGLYLIFEQLFASYDEKAFDFSNPINFSLMSVSYPVGLFDNLSAIFYYNWENKALYNFINWQKTFDKITLHTIVYLNPKNYQIPTQGSYQNLYGGFGIQLLFVYNH